MDSIQVWIDLTLLILVEGLSINVCICFQQVASSILE